MASSTSKTSSAPSSPKARTRPSSSPSCTPTTKSAVIQPIQEIGKLCHEKGILFHCDAVQAIGKIPVNVLTDNIDLMSISGHKIYGPKGVGALYVRRRNPRVQISEQINGGGHERGMRSGTLNVPGIVGLGKACEICQDEMAAEAVRETELRDYLKNKLETALDYTQVNGNMEHHLPRQPQHELHLRGKANRS